MLVMVCAWEYSCVIAKAMLSVPSVTMNGGIFALWGYCDAAIALGDADAAAAFEVGVDIGSDVGLDARLPLHAAVEVDDDDAGQHIQIETLRAVLEYGRHVRPRRPNRNSC